MKYFVLAIYYYIRVIHVYGDLIDLRKKAIIIRRELFAAIQNMSLPFNCQPVENAVRSSQVNGVACVFDPK